VLAGFLIGEQLLELADRHLADDLRLCLAVVSLCHEPNVTHKYADAVVKCRILPFQDLPTAW
jgi:hypothetical protein